MLQHSTFMSLTLGRIVHLLQVFDVRISNPKEVSVLTRMDEYRALRAANARFFGNPSQPVGHLEQEVMAGNRLYLQVSVSKAAVGLCHVYMLLVGVRGLRIKRGLADCRIDFNW